MKRTLMAVAAVGGLMVSTALAQNPTTPNTTAPSASPSTTAPSTTAPSASPSTGAATATTGAGQPVTQQSSDQWLFSKFNGTDVIGADDAKIGDVSDVLFDKQGQVDALIVGVGGFLGIGSKDVALPISSFQVVPGDNGGADKLRLSMTKDQLQQMAEFKPLDNRPTTTTGAAPGAGTSTPAGRTAPAR